MSNLHGIDDVISRIYEDLPVETKEYLLDGYIESYRHMCIVCCADLKVGLTDADDIRTGQCEDETCPGPSSKSLEEFCEEAFWAMHDNIRDCGFDTEGLSMLESFIGAWMHHQYDKTRHENPNTFEVAETIKPYSGAVWMELCRRKCRFDDLGIDRDRVENDLEYCRGVLKSLLNEEE